MSLTLIANYSNYICH